MVKLKKKCFNKKNLDAWECKYYNLDLDKIIDENELNGQNKLKISVGCDYCLELYHLKCTGLLKKPR